MMKRFINQASARNRIFRSGVNSSRNDTVEAIRARHQSEADKKVEKESYDRDLYVSNR